MNSTLDVWSGRPYKLPDSLTKPGIFCYMCVYAYVFKVQLWYSRNCFISGMDICTLLWPWSWRSKGERYFCQFLVCVSWYLLVTVNLLIGIPCINLEIYLDYLNSITVQWHAHDTILGIYIWLSMNLCHINVWWGWIILCPGNLMRHSYYDTKYLSYMNSLLSSVAYLDL